MCLALRNALDVRCPCGDNREKEEEQGKRRNKEVERRGLKRGWGTSLVDQWIGICLPMQGRQV